MKSGFHLGREHEDRGTAPYRAALLPWPLCVAGKIGGRSPLHRAASPALPSKRLDSIARSMRESVVSVAAVLARQQLAVAADQDHRGIELDLKRC